MLPDSFSKFCCPAKMRRLLFRTGDSLPVWLVMVLLMLPDGVHRRGLKVLYDMGTGKFMVSKLSRLTFVLPEILRWVPALFQCQAAGCCVTPQI